MWVAKKKKKVLYQETFLPPFERSRLNLNENRCENCPFPTWKAPWLRFRGRKKNPLLYFGLIFLAAYFESSSACVCVCVLCCFWECQSVGLKVQMCSKWRPAAAAPSQCAALWETSSSCAHCHAFKDTLEIIGASSHSELNSDCPFWDVKMKVNFFIFLPWRHWLHPP